MKPPEFTHDELISMWHLLPDQDRHTSSANAKLDLYAKAWHARLDTKERERVEAAAKAPDEAKDPLTTTKYREFLVHEIEHYCAANRHLDVKLYDMTPAQLRTVRDALEQVYVRVSDAIASK